MTPTQLRYILLQHGLGAGIFNVFLNGFIGWVIVWERPTIPMWGLTSIGGDTLIMAFILAFATGLVVSRQVKRDVLAGKVTPLFMGRRGKDLAARLPHKVLGRALLLGLGAVASFGGVTLFGMSALGIGELGASDFIVFKGCFAGVEALLVTPLVVLWTMQELEVTALKPISRPPTEEVASSWLEE